MDLNPYKKMRVGPPHHEENVQPTVDLDKWLEFNHGLQMTQIPQDDLAEIFKYCPLFLRCRLRRVCRYWKYVVGLPEVNETTIVGGRCLPVSAVFAQRITTILAGWYDRVRSEKLIVNLSDHHRHRLLGPHVRTLIYDGIEDNTVYGVLPRVLRSIGYYCTGVQHIILWRLHWFISRQPCASLAPRRVMLRPRRPSGLPQPQQLTLLASPCTLGSVSFRLDGVNGNSRHAFEVLRRGDVFTASVQLWQDDSSQSDGDFLHEFYPPYTVDQHVWVARHAPRLPECYHALLRFGLETREAFPGMIGSYCLDLNTGDYSKAHRLLLRALTYCILHEKINTEPPPQSFAT